jgi:hypothetical protein
MPIESRPASRANNPTKPNSKGFVRVKRLEINGGQVNTANVPNKADWVLVRNSGSGRIRFNTTADNAGDYLLLQPGEWIPVPLRVRAGVDLRFRAQQDSVVECLLWSD